MDYDSLTSGQRRKYFETVSGTHRRRVELVILTKNGGVVRSLTNRFLGGSISGDDTRTPVEVLECEIFDDDYVLDWKHGRHRQFKARVVDARFIPALDEWVECEVFTGPIWDFERNGPVVSLVAQGSERLAMGSVRRAFHRPRKTRATKVIRDLLEDAGAPDKGLRVPSRNATLPEAVTVGVRVGKRRDENGKEKGLGKDTRRRTRILKVDREDTYWGTAAPIARALDCDLFADGRGRFIMAPPPGKLTATLTNAHLISPVTERRGDDAEVPNTWLIYGANPKGPRPQVRARVGLPKKHPLSSQSLKWHGKPYEVTVVVENKHLRRKAQAARLGVRMRDQAVRETSEYEVSALPVVPWVRPGALFGVKTSAGQVSVRARRWTLPLGPGADPLTLGANRRSSR